MMKGTCATCEETLPAELGCSSRFVVIRSQQYDVVPYDGAKGKNCVECGVITGGHHHNDCPHELCPACGGKLVSCGCPNEENLTWTIDESELASLDDETACTRLDQMADSMVDRIQNTPAGQRVDPALLKTNIFRSMLLSMIRIVDDLKKKSARPHNGR